jgi:hypothetical protein
MALSRASACWNAIGGGCTTSRFLTKSSKDPKEYRYCGYAEAMIRGSEVALEGIRTILGLPQTASREEIDKAYRRLLNLKGRDQTVFVCYLCAFCCIAGHLWSDPPPL